MERTEAPTLQAADVAAILARYDLGKLRDVTELTAGRVQTNLLLQTTAGKFVLRHYRQNRSFDAVCFEVELIHYLTQHGFPCPAVVAAKTGALAGCHHGQPHAIFTFLAGEHVAMPTPRQQEQLVHRVADLHNLTQDFRSPHSGARWNYNPAFCEQMATEKANQLGTANARAKLAWYRTVLERLHLPPTLPSGVCHADFHFTNVLFQGEEFHALLDFDDANVTYLLFDLASLIEPMLFPFQWDTWHTIDPDAAELTFATARETVATYQQRRRLRDVEQRHLFDLLKLTILIDCLWFFERGDAADFYERRKIDCLDRMGRTTFTARLFA